MYVTRSSYRKIRNTFTILDRPSENIHSDDRKKEMNINLKRSSGNRLRRWYVETTVSGSCLMADSSINGTNLRFLLPGAVNIQITG
jgi:hypothetical protein